MSMFKQCELLSDVFQLLRSISNPLQYAYWFRFGSDLVFLGVSSHFCPSIRLPPSSRLSGLLVGYRWFDAVGRPPLLAFGHGLSYTTFRYSDLHIATAAVAAAVTATANATVSFTVTNTGARAGAEVAQLYLQCVNLSHGWVEGGGGGDVALSSVFWLLLVLNFPQLHFCLVDTFPACGSRYPAAAGEPPRVLRGFAKRLLAPGQSAAVSLPVTARDCSIWDVDAGRWRLWPGTFGVVVGASSRDLRLRGVTPVTDCCPLSPEVPTSSCGGLGSIFLKKSSFQKETLRS